MLKDKMNVSKKVNIFLENFLMAFLQWYNVIWVIV